MKEDLDSKGHVIKSVVARWLTDYYGERCEDFQSDCVCCLAWMGHDLMFQNLEKEPDVKLSP